MDIRLNRLYSFGRLNPYNPFIGGFVRENKNFGTFKRFKNSKVLIYSIDVEEENYQKASEIINKIKVNKEEYKFNIIGLILVMFNKSIKRNKAFYCAEFVKYVLENSKSIDEELPKIIKPADFNKIEGITLEYKGLLRTYDYKQTYSFRKLMMRKEAII